MQQIANSVLEQKWTSVLSESVICIQFSMSNVALQTEQRCLVFSTTNQLALHLSRKKGTVFQNPQVALYIWNDQKLTDEDEFVKEKKRRRAEEKMRYEQELKRWEGKFCLGC